MAGLHEEKDLENAHKIYTLVNAAWISQIEQQFTCALTNLRIQTLHEVRAMIFPHDSSECQPSFN